MKSILVFAILFLLPFELHAAWKTFTSNPGQFSVSFPTTPTETQTQEKTLIGAIGENIFTSKSDTGTFTVEYSLLPEVAVVFGGHKGIFDKAKEGFLKKTGAQEISFTDVSLGGRQGKELAYQTPGGQAGKVRMYLDGKRFYFLDAKSSQGDQVLTQFLNSFTILP